MPNPIQLFVPTFRVEETLQEIRECGKGVDRFGL